MSWSFSISTDLGRLAHDLIALIDGLEKRGIGFKAINSPMDTTTPAGRAFLQIQAAFAEMERNLIRQRVKEGIVAARARGRKGGRPRVMTGHGKDLHQILTHRRRPSDAMVTVAPAG